MPNNNRAPPNKNQTAMFAPLLSGTTQINRTSKNPLYQRRCAFLFAHVMLSQNFSFTNEIFLISRSRNETTSFSWSINNPDT